MIAMSKATSHDILRFGFFFAFFIAIAVAACFFILADFGGRPLVEP